MKKVLVLGKIHQSGLDILGRETDLDVTELPDHAPDLMDHLPDADAIIVRMTKITRDVISAAPGLRLVARHGVGYEAVDVGALTERGIPLAIVGDVNSTAVAEHTLALMLTLAKKFIPYDAATRKGKFDIRDSFSATELLGKTILIVGFGRIGREVAKRCLPFGMRVIAADPFASAADAKAAGCGHVADFRGALSKADYVTIHAPKTEETKNLVGPDELAAMKPGGYLINVARGGMVDEAALFDALSSGGLRAAALDVFEPEPPAADNPLFTLDNFVATPHCGAFTEECGERMAEVCARNVLGALAGTLDPALVVNKEILKP